MKSDLIRAAEALEYEAIEIRRRCTVILGDGVKWLPGRARDEAKSRHDDYLALANRLRKAK